MTPASLGRAKSKSAGVPVRGLEARLRDALNIAQQPGHGISRVRILRTEGKTVHGLVGMTDRGLDNHVLLDFQATLGADGEVASLEVNGKKVSLVTAKPRKQRQSGP